MTAADILLRLLMLTALLWCCRICWVAVQDNHARGKARIHRGTSWTPRGRL